jgi:hypothetical protein
MAPAPISLGGYLAGLALFVLTWGASGLTALLLVRRAVPPLDPVARALAWALLFVAALLAAHLLPGAVGLLSAGSAALTAAIAALLASRLPRRAHPLPRRPPVTWNARTAAAALGVGAAALWPLAALFEVRLEPPMHVDALSFALPGVGGWVTSGSIWHVGEFLPFLQVRTYPNNGDALALAAILPWRDDAFLRLLAPPLLAVTALAAYATGRELGAPAPTAALLGAGIVATSTAGGSALFDLKPDAVMYATFAAGVFFAVRHGRTGARSDLLLAGLGLGLALGSRWYGVTAVAAVVAVWAAAFALARRPRPWPFRPTALLGLAIAAGGGFWLVRNAVLTGNPLYPVDLGPIGLGAPRDVFTEKFGFTVAERVGEGGFAGDELLPSLWRAFGASGLAVLAGAAVAAVLAAMRRAPARVLALLGASALVGLTYAFLPGSAQGSERGAFEGIVEENMRWLMPAAILAAGPAAWAAGRLRRGATALDLVLLGCLVATLQRSFSPEPRHVAIVAALAAVAAAAIGAVRATAARGRGPAAALAATLVAGVVALGYAHERRYDRDRYVGLSAAVDWVNEHGRSDRRVGVAGNWSAQRFVPIYPLFGPRLENDVEYVGPLVDEQLRQYTSAAPFSAALRRERYDLLAVGTLTRPDFEDLRPQRRVRDPEEARWARRAGYVEVARDADFVLLSRRPAPGASQ